MSKINYGILHNHTMHSIKDSVVTISGLVQKGKELGAPAIALTDHGAMTGCYEFYKICNESDIKPILGCEFYVKNYSFGSRLHLIVMAKDYTGYQAMMKCVKLSNRNLTKVGTLIFPESNIEILESCFGKNSKGYGHVIATSACINGVVAGLAYQNEGLTEKYNANLSKIEKSDFAKEQIKKFETMIQQYETVIEKKESDVSVKEAKEKIKAIKKNITVAKKEVLDEQVYLDCIRNNQELSILYKGSKAELLQFMEQETLKYEELFGKGNFYIELQNHGMPEEKEYMYQMDLIAQKHNIPTCAANDAHMLDGSYESILARQTIAGLRWNDIEAVSDSEKEVFIKTDDELLLAITNVVGPVRAQKAMEGIKSVVDSCNVKLPENPKHYPVFDKNVDSMSLLVEEVKKGILDRFPNGDMPENYRERLNYELKIIKPMNVADYLLIVQDLLRFGRKLGKMPEERYQYLETHVWEMSFDEIVAYVDEDQSYFGYTVGPGRGSSAGSLVCYMIGITDLDPMPYNLLFERFLNPERVSMPDIDSDYGNGYREVVIAYTYKKYGDDAVCRIITYGTNSAKAAIKNVARAIGKTKAQGNDFIIKHYQDLGDKLAKVCSGKPHDVLSNYDAQWAAMDDECKEIITRAKSIEGSYSQYGMHACGVIISDNDDVNEYVPLSWDEKNSCWKSQCVPAEAEEQGLLKMDYLGLKNLNMITEIIRLIEVNHGIRINPTLIPVEPDVIQTICKNGSTNSIFQLESAGMKDICKKMKPDCFEDIILLVAAYRPGPMDSIPDIIAVKTGQKPAEYLVPELEHILNVTYAKPIYQEQVQQIFRDLAGYSFGQADNVRRAMSKKKEKILLAERDAFVNGDLQRGIEGCAARGIAPEKANQLFDEMIDFAKYAFNKSHAAVYARIAYIMMWLKVKYFAEFMTVALKWASDKQVMGLIDECHEGGVEVLPPDINKSGEDFTVSENKILYGLSSIKGIVSVDKIMEARKEKPFSDFKDFIKRGHFKKNVTESLIWSGAFDSIASGRKAVSLMMDQLVENNDAIADKEAKISETEEIIRILSVNAELPKSELLKLIRAAGYKGKTVPKIEKKQKDLYNYLLELKSLNQMNDIIEEPLMFKDDKEFNLKKEKELLGVYLTGHPTDSYVASSKCIPIEELRAGKFISVFGAVTNLRIKQRKSDNAAMAFFNLEDKTGSIEVCCFTKAYAQYGHKLSDGAVIEVVGNVNEELVSSGSEDDEEETVLKLSVTEIKSASKKLRTMMLSLNLITDWDDVSFIAKEYLDNSNSACNLVVWDKAANELRKTKYKVKDSILSDNRLVVTEI